jgi:hypothetical protein
MTGEQLKEAVQRNCYHLNLARLLHADTLIWSPNWQCLDCLLIFISTPLSADEQLRASATVNRDAA